MTWRYTVAGGEMALFLNGTLISNGGGHPPFIGTGNTLIGRCCETWDSPRYAKGAIDDVKIYSRALTAAEIATLPTPPAPPQPVQTVTFYGGQLNGQPVGSADPTTEWTSDLTASIPQPWNVYNPTYTWTGNLNPAWRQAYLVGAHPWGYVPGTNSWINCGPNVQPPG